MLCNSITYCICYWTFHKIIYLLLITLTLEKTLQNNVLNIGTIYFDLIAYLGVSTIN